MSSYSTAQIIVNVICLLVGCAFGYYMGMKQVHEQHPERHLHMSKKQAWFNKNSRKVAGVLLFLLAIFVVIQNMMVSQRVDQQSKERTAWVQAQTECNEQFLEVIRRNAVINKEDRELEARDDALREERDDALDDLVQGLIRISGEGNNEDVPQLLQDYERVVTENREQRVQLDKERADLSKARAANPYPEPRCE